jgi:hypothetical protein
VLEKDRLLLQRTTSLIKFDSESCDRLKNKWASDIYIGLTILATLKLAGCSVWSPSDVGMQSSYVMHSSAFPWRVLTASCIVLHFRVA